jgi:hypothetical protein
VGSSPTRQSEFKFAKYRMKVDYMSDFHRLTEGDDVYIVTVHKVTEIVNGVAILDGGELLISEFYDPESQEAIKNIYGDL